MNIIRTASLLSIPVVILLNPYTTHGDTNIATPILQPENRGYERLNNNKITQAIMIEMEIQPKSDYWAFTHQHLVSQKGNPDMTNIVPIFNINV